MTTPDWQNYNFTSVVLQAGDVYRVKIPESNNLTGQFSANHPITNGYIVFPAHIPATSFSIELTQAGTTTYAERKETVFISGNLFSHTFPRYPTQSLSINSVFQLPGAVPSSVTSNPSITSFSGGNITCNVANTATVTVTLPVNTYNTITSTFQLTVTKLAPTVTSTMSTGILQVPRVITVPTSLNYTTTYLQNGQVVSQPRRSGPYQSRVTTTETGTYSQRTVTIDFTFTRGSTARLLRLMGINYPYRY